MGEHRDAEVADVVVVLDKSCEGSLPATLQQLKDAGFELTETDEDDLTISGTIDAAKLPTIKAMKCVDYVRVSMTYIADYPPSDARDRDGSDGSDNDTVDDD